MPAGVDRRIMNILRAQEDVGSDGLEHTHQDQTSNRLESTTEQPEVDDIESETRVPRKIGNLARRITGSK